MRDAHQYVSIWINKLALIIGFLFISIDIFIKFSTINPFAYQQLDSLIDWWFYYYLFLILLSNFIRYSLWFDNEFRYFIIIFPVSRIINVLLEYSFRKDHAHSTMFIYKWICVNIVWRWCVLNGENLFCWFFLPLINWDKDNLKRNILQKKFLDLFTLVCIFQSRSTCHIAAATFGLNSNPTMVKQFFFSQAVFQCFVYIPFQ